MLGTLTHTESSRADQRPPTPQKATLALPSQASSVPIFRRFCADLTRYWSLSTDDQDSAVLVVGELAANSAQYGRASTILLMTLNRDSLVIEVMDSGPAISRQPPRGGRDPDEHGRGLLIVQSVAQRTEIHESEHGFRVWADMGSVMNWAETHSGGTPEREP